MHHKNHRSSSTLGQKKNKYHNPAVSKTPTKVVKENGGYTEKRWYI